MAKTGTCLADCLIVCCVFCFMYPAATSTPLIEESHMDIICRNILNLQCHIFVENYINCGTDGHTYNNSCEFAQAHCRYPELHVLHSGRCVASGGGVQGSQPVEQGLQAVLQLVCDDIVHVDCAGQPAVSMCASDGLTYDNNCAFEKARCRRYGLHVLHAGRC